MRRGDDHVVRLGRALAWGLGLAMVLWTAILAVALVLL